MTDLQTAARAILTHWDSLQTVDLVDAVDCIEALRQALEESPNSAKNVVEPENTQAQELSGKTEQLEAEIKRLQELADYRLKLLTKMPSEGVDLTDEDIEELRCHGAHSVSDTDFRAIEAKLKEKHEWKRDPRDMCGNE